MDVLEAIGQARDAMTVRRVYGEPYQEGGVTIIPAAHVMGGGGGGSGQSGESGPAGSGQGMGFGMRARPAGAWIIKDGDARWKPAVDVNRIVLTSQLVAIVFLLTVRSIAKAIAKGR